MRRGTTLTRRHRVTLGVTAPLEGQPAHERTVEEFVGDPRMISEDLSLWNEEGFFLYGPKRSDYRIIRRDFYRTPPYRTMLGGTEIRTVFDSFSLGIVRGRPLHALLLVQLYDAATGEPMMEEGPVGEFYPEFFGNILGIAEAYRGKGVGPEFLAAAIEETGNVSPPPAYSPGGLRNRARAHRILVRNAILRGDEVPPRVLAQYPDLAEEFDQPHE